MPLSTLKISSSISMTAPSVMCMYVEHCGRELKIQLFIVTTRRLIYCIMHSMQLDHYLNLFIHLMKKKTVKRMKKKFN